MRKWKKVLIGIALIFIITFIVAGGIFHHMLLSALPNYQGEVSSSKVSTDVEIYRDSLAVPYIIANSDQDIAFALGYLHAQERLFSMDLVRRAGEGKLSEILGPKALPFDKMFRTVGVKRNILKNYKISIKLRRCKICTATKKFHCFKFYSSFTK